MRILITGSDGSLGSTLVSKAAALGFEVAMVPMEAMYATNFKLLVDEIATIKPCNFIINNHGVNFLSPIEDEISAEGASLLMTNIAMPYEIVSAAARAKWQNVKVINVASLTYRVPQRMSSLYCASKAALVQMTKVMARELAPRGWTVNAIAPGRIDDTRMTELVNEQVNTLRGFSAPGGMSWDEYALSQIPAGRFTNREEVAEAIFKLFEMPSYMNGACIDFTGGM
jgi:3-oxoacyl-[acyl-carrier protein] reductase